jgi:hypothetical protein
MAKTDMQRKNAESGNEIAVKVLRKLVCDVAHLIFLRN